MHTYCLQADIEAIWPPDELLASVDDDASGTLSPTEQGYITRAIERAANLMNARLETRYRLSELATNTLQHARGGGVVRIWAEPGRVLCEVVDRGAPRYFGRDMPAADQPRGRGLAIVERICDEVGIDYSPAGTAVRLGMLH